MKRIIAAAIITITAAPVLADQYVNGYYRNDGTYVQPHYRSSPDGNKLCPTKRDHVFKLCRHATGVSECPPLRIVLVAVVHVRRNLMSMAVANIAVACLAIAYRVIAQVVSHCSTVRAMRAKIAAQKHRAAVP